MHIAAWAQGLVPDQTDIAPRWHPSYVDVIAIFGSVSRKNARYGVVGSFWDQLKNSGGTTKAFNLLPLRTQWRRKRVLARGRRATSSVGLSLVENLFDATTLATVEKYAGQ